ncbi:MAG TPA: hypothetical protein VKT27_14140 [Candidatus Binataceae bacterium]|nr:hypothetical protein [Candidatus Binataceae bacterium]
MSVNLSRSFRMSGHRSLIVFTLFTAEAVLLAILFLPATLGFAAWAYSDQGANLTAQYLVARGYQPAIDFGYPYGLLPLLVAHIWFWLFAATPQACFGITAICAVLIACAFARIVLALNVELAGIMLLLITLPLTIPFYPPNLTHICEALLLTNALADHAARRYSRALALIAACLFVKPSMGFLYGFLLVLMIICKLMKEKRLSLRNIVRIVAPALLTTAVVSAVLALSYGSLSLVESLLPFAGMHTYAAQNFGFFRAGRALWNPLHPTVGYYLKTPAGFWIVASLWLVACGIAAAKKAFSRGSISHEVVLCCALLHIGFVALFFGNRMSWVYYAYILTIGVAITSRWSPFFRNSVCALALLAVVGQTANASIFKLMWKATSPDRETAGLWASKATIADWHHLVETVSDVRRKGGSASFLEGDGCAELLLPGLNPPVSLYLYRGEAAESDVSRKLQQLSQSAMIAVLTRTLTEGLLPNEPEFRRILSRYRLIWKGEAIEIYER